jgi:hypothetical protein
MGVGGKMSKYGAKRKDGFHSKKESKRYQDLLLMEKLGLVRNLQTQVKFVLIPPGKGQWRTERECSYFADFVYDESVRREGKDPLCDWQYIVEDVKGYKTTDYIIKRKLLLHLYGISIRET